MRIMLWLCICLPRLPLEALSLDTTEPAVVTLTEGRSRRILIGNSAAERVGLTKGVDYTTAIAVHPQLTALERNARAERLALERLAAWAYQWSSSVVVHSPDTPSLTDIAAVWIEISGSFALFG